jgi:formate hydrogenlyase subunit 4
VLLLSAVAAGTARFTLDRSIRFYWRWAAILAILAISSAIYMGFRS